MSEKNPAENAEKENVVEKSSADTTSTESDETLKKVEEELTPETSEVADEVKAEISDVSLETAGTDAPDSSSEVTEATSVAATASTAEPKSNSRLWQVGLVVAGLIAVFALTSSGFFSGKEAGDAAAVGNPNDPIAKVNGEIITREEYDQQVKQAETVLMAMGGGAQAENEAFLDELKGRILDDLVNAEILFQKASENGFAATDEMIQEEYDRTVEQMGGEEVLETQLSTIGLDKDGLRELLGRQIAIENYVNDQTSADEVEVTEEEIQEFYDASVSSAPEGIEVPSLEEVRPQIEAQLAQEKASGIIQEFVAGLREEAEIEILI